MAFQVEKTYKTKNSNTYSTVAEFIAEHGPCGRDNLNHVMEQGSAVLADNQSMKVTVKYNTEAEYDTHKVIDTGAGANCEVVAEVTSTV